MAALEATAELLLAYHNAVVARTLAYLRDATEDDLARERLDAAFYRDSTPRGQLIGVLSDSLQHAGQIAYLRGLLAERHWGAA